MSARVLLHAVTGN